MKGKVTNYLASKDLGFILGEDGKTYAFSKDDLVEFGGGQY